MIRCTSLIAFSMVVALWLSDPDHRPGVAEGNDLRVFYDGAAQFAATGNPYGSGFVSPAPYAFLLVPISGLPFDVVAAVWFGLSVAAVLGISATSLRLTELPVNGMTTAGLAALLFLWPANNYGLLLGQNSVFVGLAETMGTLAAATSPSAAGVLFGFAALVKPHLVLPLALALVADELRRDGTARFGQSFVLIVVGLVACTALASRRWLAVLITAPPESWNYWGSTVGTNVYLAAALEDRAAGWFLLAVIAVTLVVAVSTWWWRTGPPLNELACSVLAVTLLITPYAYPHDYVLLVPATLLLLGRLWRIRSPLTIAVAGSVALMAWFAPRPAQYDAARFVALAYPLALVVGLAWTARSAHSAEPAASSQIRAFGPFQPNSPV